MDVHDLYLHFYTACKYANLWKFVTWNLLGIPEGMLLCGNCTREPFEKEKIKSGILKEFIYMFFFAETLGTKSYSACLNHECK